MKKAGRKLIVSAFVLVVALSLAVTSTFAWFTMTNNPSVEGFDINVTTSEGLTISLKNEAGSYKSRITSAAISNFLTAKYGESNVILDAVTSENGYQFKVIDTDDGYLYYDVGTETYTPTGAGDVKLKDTTSGYISFPVYFYSAKPLSVKLNDEGNSVARKLGHTVTPVTAWKNITAGEYGKTPLIGNADTPHAAISTGAAIPANAANAARISFVNEAGSSAIVWYPNPDKGYNGDINYKVPAEESFTAANLAIDYFNQRNLTTVKQPAYLQTQFSKSYYVEPVYTEGSLITAGNFIIDDTLVTLAPNADGVEGAGYYGMVTVNIWLEGFDGDCFDTIFADAITVLLQFIGE